MDLAIPTLENTGVCQGTIQLFVLFAKETIAGIDVANVWPALATIFRKGNGEWVTFVGPNGGIGVIAKAQVIEGQGNVPTCKFCHLDGRIVVWQACTGSRRPCAPIIVGTAFVDAVRGAAAQQGQERALPQFQYGGVHPPTAVWNRVLLPGLTLVARDLYHTVVVAVQTFAFFFTVIHRQ